MGKPAPFGKYQILRELGRGGMGVVYEAFDAALGRKVALKTMIVSSHANPEEAITEGERFLREARLSAGLAKHPHIVGVYEVGVVDGRRYLAMELIEGKPLSEWRKEESVTLREEIEVLRMVALAVHHAHEQGVIHRDLKPPNILIDAKKEPHVTDFGLAKMVGENLSVSLTGAGMIVGTPAYISPEQAEGSKATDRRTDVYALGVMLFEMVTGRHPFTGETAMEILMKASKNAVPSVSSLMKIHLTPVQAKGLDDICHKALAKKAQDRYRDAAAFAGDLDKWLKGEDVKVALPTRRATASPKPNWARIAGIPITLGVLVIVLVQVLSRPKVDLAEAEKQRVETVRLDAQRRIQEENLRVEREKLEAARRQLEALQPPFMKAVEVKNDHLLKPGLVGEYFSGTNFEILCLRRTDAEARWICKVGQAWPDGPFENVSVRWQGYLRIPEKGLWTVHASASEAMRVYIDNVEVVSSWPPRPAGPQVGMLYLDQGYHTLLMEYVKSGNYGGSVWMYCKKGTDPAAEKLHPSHFVHDPTLFKPVQRKVVGLGPDRKSLPGAQEAEALKIVEAPPGSTGVLPIFARDKGFLLWGKTKPGDRLVLQFAAAEDGEKTLVLTLGRARNGGMFRIAVNGAVIAEKLDLYHPSNHFMEHDFKKVALRLGANELEFTLLGSNKDAIPWNKDDGVHKLSIDYLRMR